MCDANWNYIKERARTSILILCTALSVHSMKVCTDRNTTKGASKSTYSDYLNYVRYQSATSAVLKGNIEERESEYIYIYIYNIVFCILL